MIEYTCGRCQDLHDEQAEKIEKLEKAVEKLLAHASERGRIYDRTHVAGEEESHYYEIDASFIDEVKKVLEND